MHIPPGRFGGNGGVGKNDSVTVAPAAQTAIAGGKPGTAGRACDSSAIDRMSANDGHPAE